MIFIKFLIRKTIEFKEGVLSFSHDYILNYIAFGLNSIFLKLSKCCLTKLDVNASFKTDSQLKKRFQPQKLKS